MTITLTLITDNCRHHLLVSKGNNNHLLMVVESNIYHQIKKSNIFNRNIMTKLNNMNLIKIIEEVMIILKLIMWLLLIKGIHVFVGRMVKLWWWRSQLIIIIMKVWKIVLLIPWWCHLTTNKLNKNSIILLTITTNL